MLNPSIKISDHSNMSPISKRPAQCMQWAVAQIMCNIYTIALLDPQAVYELMINRQGGSHNLLQFMS